MSAVLDRWKIVVDFVQCHDVSDVSLWGENLTARMDGEIFGLAEAGALSRDAVSEMIRELLMIDPERARAMSQPMFITNQRLLRRRWGGRLAVREVCVHAPNIEAVILRGN